MKKTVGMAAVCLLVASSALAQSPIPTFDKEAVTRTRTTVPVSRMLSVGMKLHPENSVPVTPAQKMTLLFMLKALSLPALNCRIKWDGFRKF